MAPPPKRQADSEANGEAESKKQKNEDDAEDVTPVDEKTDDDKESVDSDKSDDDKSDDDKSDDDNEDADNEDAEAEGCGEVMFCGMANWDLMGRKETPKGAKKNNGPNLWDPHRLETLQGVKVRSVFSGCCATHCAVVDSKGQVYTWGRNDNGQLGNGNKNRVDLPEAVSTLDNENVVSVAMGRRHTLFLTAKGEVYACGDNKLGQLGIGSTSNTEVTTPTRIDYKGPPIKRISCGAEFCCIVDIKGNIYTFGSPEYGQLGHNTDGKYFVTSNKVAYHTENSPRVVTVFVEKAKGGQVSPVTDVTVTEIACGVNHTIMLDSNKRVFAWGFGGYGRLGNESPKDVMVPQMLNFFAGPKRGASMVACGSSFSLAVNEHGVLYFWGQAKSSGEATMYPKVVTDLQGWKVRSMACASKGIMVAADDGLVSWGPSPAFGELCYGEDCKSSSKPKECKPMDDHYVMSVACGMNCSLFLVKNDTQEEKDKVEEVPVYSGPM